MRLSTSLLAVLLSALCAAPAPAKTAPKQGTPAPLPYVEHKVTRGETLWRIAQKHRTSVGAIMDYNRMADQTVKEGSTLRIPKPQPQVPRPRQQVHVVRDGETFWSIAERYHLPPKALADANPNINPNRLHPDMELLLPSMGGGAGSSASSSNSSRPTPQPPPPPKGITEHMVQGNETYYSIAKRYGVSMESVVAANPSVKPERLRPGMVVAVPVKSGTKGGTPSPGPAQASTTSGRTYKVREGDTIPAIARKLGVSEEALLKANNLSRSEPFYVDDVLKVPGPASSGKSAQNSKPTPSPTPAPAPGPGSKSGSKSSMSSSQGKSSAKPLRAKDGSVPSYTVSGGETVSSIAAAYQVTPKQLLDHNHLASNATLKEGDEIAIPGPGRR